MNEIEKFIELTDKLEIEEIHAHLLEKSARLTYELSMQANTEYQIAVPHMRNSLITMIKLFEAYKSKLKEKADNVSGEEWFCGINFEILKNNKWKREEKSY